MNDQTTTLPEPACLSFEDELRAAMAEEGEIPLEVVAAGAEPTEPSPHPAASDPVGTMNAWRNRSGDRRGVHLAHGMAGARRLQDLREKGYNGDLSELHNTELPEDFAPTHKKEKYEHRIIAYYKAQGYSLREIAELTGYAYGSIVGIMKLPWVRQAVMEEITRCGRDAVKATLDGTVMDSLHYLIETRDSEECRRQDRTAAAKELLDRALGKANQPITHMESKDLTKLTDKELAVIVAAGGRAN